MLALLKGASPRSYRMDDHSLFEKQADHLTYLSASGPDEHEPERRPQEQEGSPQRSRLSAERPFGGDDGDARGIEECDQKRRHAWRSGGGEGERGGEPRHRYQDGDEEAVAGVERVGEDGREVSERGAQEAEGQDGTGDRDGDKVREDANEKPRR